MILVPHEIKDNVLHALYKSAGLNTPGQGIAFAVPVSDVVGLTDHTQVRKQAKESAKAEDESKPEATE